MIDSEQKVRDQFRTHLEKVMLQLPSETLDQHPMYLAGYIDALSDMGAITENTREILYSEYAL